MRTMEKSTVMGSWTAGIGEDGNKTGMCHKQDKL